MNKILVQAYLLLLFSVGLWSCADNSKQATFQLKEGDLLFQNTGTGEVDKAIKDVTATSLSRNYSHVGIAMEKNGKFGNLCK